MTIAELHREVALNVNEVAEVERDVGNLEETAERETEVRIEAKREIEIAQQIERTAKESERIGQFDIAEEIAEVEIEEAGKLERDAEAEARIDFEEIQETQHAAQTEAQGQRQVRHIDREIEVRQIEIQIQSGEIDVEAGQLSEVQAEIDIDRGQRNPIGDVEAAEARNVDRAHEFRGADVALEPVELHPAHVHDAAELRRHDGESEVEVADRKTECSGLDVIVDIAGVGVPVRSADTGEGVNIARRDGQHFGARRDVEAGALEIDCRKRLLLESKRTLHADKLRERETREAGARHDAAGVEVEADRAAANIDRETRRISARGRETRREIHIAAGRTHVDLDRDILNREIEYVGIEADDADAVGRRLDREVGLIADNSLHQDHREIEIGDREPECVFAGLAGIDLAVLVGVGPIRAVQSHERRGVLHRQIHGIDGHIGERAKSSQPDIDVGSLPLREGDIRPRINETADIQRGVMDRATQARGGEIDHHIVATGADRQAGRRTRRPGFSREARGEIDDGAERVIRTVQFERDVFRRELEGVVIESVDLDGIGGGLQRGIGVAASLDLHQAECQAFDPEAIESIRLLLEGLRWVDRAIDIADEGVDVAAADRETFAAENRQTVAQAEIRRILGFLETKPAAEIEEAVN